jgi:3D (Asp-Asp-Asp) domain-containing protein
MRLFPDRRPTAKYNLFGYAFFILLSIYVIAVCLIAYGHFSGMVQERVEYAEAMPTPSASPVVIAWPEANASQRGLVESPQRVSLGTYTVTAYCPCPKCCGKWSHPEDPTTASGEPAVEGVTVGADWATIAEGTQIEIEGIGSRTVQDKPAAWIVERYGGKILDLYFSDHQAALDFGKRELEVWAVNG